MMVKLNGCIFLIEDHNLFGKYNSTWDKVSVDIEKNNLLTTLPITKSF